MTVRSSHNFIIGDLGFHKLLDNEEHAYERATAPFRKEQFDSSPTVGDQSLAGWWTRGQLSFHKGAGVKYYEVLEGEEVLNRFDSGANLDIFTPGRARMGPQVDTSTEAFTPKDMVRVLNLYYGAEFLTLDTDGGIWRSSEAIYAKTAVTTATAGTAASVTASTHEAFVAVNGTNGVIEKWVTGGASSTAVWTNTSAHWEGVWYAKGRLIALDTAGNLYMLPTSTTGTVTSTDAFAKLTGVAGKWHLADTPGPVLLSNQTTVWSMSVDLQATTPVPTVPEVVATLPEGEEVTVLGYHVGHVVLGTRRGVRFGTLTSSGEIVYGPLVSDVICAEAQRIGVRNSRVIISGKRDKQDGNRCGAYAFDLSQQVSELQPSWCMSFTTAPTDAGWSGVLAYSDMTISWTSSSVQEIYAATDTYKSATPTTLTTGFHRLGTLDGKHFQEVLVRVGGIEGTMQVYRVDADGTETSLGAAWDVTTGDKVLSLGLDAPVERIALKFVMTRGQFWSGPELLGYQIKALPSPKRQRLIRVPLMMFDTERGPTGRSIGAEKSAWARYEALESLEETDALVTFEDKDTGETGTVYIESVELMQKNGSKGHAKSNGFGGVVTVTLRKVSGA